MEPKKVGEVTEEEKKIIKNLFERKLALQDMLCALPGKRIDEEAKSELYEKFMIDLGNTKVLFDNWWSEKTKKYNWIIDAEGELRIDFCTNEIILIT